MSKAAKKKEEERIEKIIRNLLKLPENRRCINCTSLGPQYVCTTFWTFVCTNCSGLHREFTHRVKSVSMAKFSAEEVSYLQAGGNERAREIYFKVWDPQRHVFPDGSNQNRLRDFIRQVYVDKKYSGESTAKPTVTKTDAREEPFGRRSVDGLSYGSKYPVDERRSPRYKQDTVKTKFRPAARLEIVDDRFKDEDSGRGRRSDAKKYESSETKSLPEMRSVKDILGEDIPTLRVGKSPEGDIDGKNNKNTGTPEKVASSSVNEPNDVKPPEVMREKSLSLIDLMDDPEPSDSEAAPQTINANEGSFKYPRTVNNSNAAQLNSVELMLFELSAPANGEIPGNVDTPNVASSGEIELILPNSSSDISSTTQHPVPPAGASSDQAWNLTPVPNTQSSSTGSVIEPIQTGINVAQEITSLAGPEASSLEAKSRGRGELPMDLFSGSYPSFQAPVQNWQYRPSYGMGFNVHQHYPPNSMPGPAFANVARPRNPFDLNDDPTHMQTAVYSSMLPGQDALFSSSHTNSSQLMQSQASLYQAIPPSQISTYGMSPVPGAFSRQQLPYGMPLSASQGDNGSDTAQQNDSFAGLTPIKQRVPSTENSFPSVGGNPFG